MGLKPPNTEKQSPNFSKGLVLRAILGLLLEQDNWKKVLRLLTFLSLWF